MMTQLIRNWRLLVWRGLAIMLLSLTALIWPVAMLTVLRLLFGAYALADGGLALVISQFDRHKFYPGWTLRLGGLVSIILGIRICLWPSVTASALVTIIATCVILTRAFKAAEVYVAEGKWQSVWDNLIKHKMLRIR